MVRLHDKHRGEQRAVVLNMNVLSKKKRIVNGPRNCQLTTVSPAFTHPISPSPHRDADHPRAKKRRFAAHQRRRHRPAPRYSVAAASHLHQPLIEREGRREKKTMQSVTTKEEEDTGEGQTYHHYRHQQQESHRPESAAKDSRRARVSRKRTLDRPEPARLQLLVRRAGIFARRAST